MIVHMTTRPRGQVTTISISGSLTRSQGVGVLCEKTWELILTGCRWILIDMAGLSSIDCFGMGDLITALTTARDAGGDIKLVNVGDPIKRMLQLTRLDTVFEIHDDEVRAAKSFGLRQTTSLIETPSECFVG